MGLLLLIPGIILLATDGWFNDQHTVGTILTWAGAIIIALQVLFVVFGLIAAGKTHSAARQRIDNRRRRY